MYLVNYVFCHNKMFWFYKYIIYNKFVYIHISIVNMVGFFLYFQECEEPSKLAIILYKLF